MDACGTRRWWTRKKSASKDAKKKAIRGGEGTTKKKLASPSQQQQRQQRSCGEEKVRGRGRKSAFKRNTSPRSKLFGLIDVASLSAFLPNKVANRNRRHGGGAPASAMQQRMQETLSAESPSRTVTHAETEERNNLEQRQRARRSRTNEVVGIAEKNHVCNGANNRIAPQVRKVGRGSSRDDERVIYGEGSKTALSADTNFPREANVVVENAESGAATSSKPSGREVKGTSPSQGVSLAEEQYTFPAVEQKSPGNDIAAKPTARASICDVRIEVQSCFLNASIEEPQICLPFTQGESTVAVTSDFLVIIKLSPLTPSSAKNLLATTHIGSTEKTLGNRESHAGAYPQHPHELSTAATSCPHSPVLTDKKLSQIFSSAAGAPANPPSLDAAGPGPVSAAGVSLPAGDAISASAASLTFFADECTSPSAHGCAVTAGVTDIAGEGLADETVHTASDTKIKRDRGRTTSRVVYTDVPVPHWESGRMVPLSRRLAARPEEAAASAATTAAVTDERLFAGPSLPQLAQIFSLRKMAPVSANSANTSAASAAADATPPRSANLRVARRAVVNGGALRQTAERAAEPHREEPFSQPHRRDQQQMHQQDRPEQGNYPRPPWNPKQQHRRTRPFTVTTSQQKDTQRVSSECAPSRKTNSTLLQQQRLFRHRTAAESAADMKHSAKKHCTGTDEARKMTGGISFAAAVSAGAAIGPAAAVTRTAVLKSMLKQQLLQQGPAGVSAAVAPTRDTASAHEPTAARAMLLQYFPSHEDANGQPAVHASSPLSAYSFAVAMPSPASFASAAERPAGSRPSPEGCPSQLPRSASAPALISDAEVKAIALRRQPPKALSDSAGLCVAHSNRAGLLPGCKVAPVILSSAAVTACRSPRGPQSVLLCSLSAPQCTASPAHPVIPSTAQASNEDVAVFNWHQQRQRLSTKPPAHSQALQHQQQTAKNFPGGDAILDSNCVTREGSAAQARFASGSGDRDDTDADELCPQRKFYIASQKLLGGKEAPHRGVQTTDSSTNSTAVPACTSAHSDGAHGTMLSSSRCAGNSSALVGTEGSFAAIREGEENACGVQQEQQQEVGERQRKHFQPFDAWSARLSANKNLLKHLRNVSSAQMTVQFSAVVQESGLEQQRWKDARGARLPTFTRGSDRCEHVTLAPRTSNGASSAPQSGRPSMKSCARAATIAGGVGTALSSALQCVAARIPAAQNPPLREQQLQSQNFPPESRNKEVTEQTQQLQSQKHPPLPLKEEKAHQQHRGGRQQGHHEQEQHGKFHWQAGVLTHHKQGVSVAPQQICGRGQSVSPPDQKNRQQQHCSAEADTFRDLSAKEEQHLSLSEVSHKGLIKEKGLLAAACGAAVQHSYASQSEDIFPLWQAETATIGAGENADVSTAASDNFSASKRASLSKIAALISSAAPLSFIAPTSESSAGGVRPSESAPAMTTASERVGTVNTEAAETSVMFESTVKGARGSASEKCASDDGDTGPLTTDARTKSAKEVPHAHSVGDIVARITTTAAKAANAPGDAAASSLGDVSASRVSRSPLLEARQTAITKGITAPASLVARATPAVTAVTDEGNLQAAEGRAAAGPHADETASTNWDMERKAAGKTVAAAQAAASGGEGTEALTLTEAVLATLGQGVTTVLEYGAATLRDFITESLPALSSDGDNSPPSDQCIRNYSSRSNSASRSHSDTQKLPGYEGKKHQRGRDYHHTCVRRACSAGAAPAGQASFQSIADRYAVESIILPPPLLIRECLQHSDPAAADNRREHTPLSSTGANSRRSSSFSKTQYKTQLKKAWCAAARDNRQTKITSPPFGHPNTASAVPSSESQAVRAAQLHYCARSLSPAVSEPHSMFRQQLRSNPLQHVYCHNPAAAPTAFSPGDTKRTSTLDAQDLPLAANPAGTVVNRALSFTPPAQRIPSRSLSPAEGHLTPTALTRPAACPPHVPLQCCRLLLPRQRPRGRRSPLSAVTKTILGSAAAAPPPSVSRTPRALSPAGSFCSAVSAAIPSVAAAVPCNAARNALKKRLIQGGNVFALTRGKSQEDGSEVRGTSVPMLLPAGLQREQSALANLQQQKAALQQQQAPSTRHQYWLSNGRILPLHVAPVGGRACLPRESLPRQLQGRNRQKSVTLAEQVQALERTRMQKQQQYTQQQYSQQHQAQQKNIQREVALSTTELVVPPNPTDSSAAAGEGQPRTRSCTSSSDIRKLGGVRSSQSLLKRESEDCSARDLPPHLLRYYAEVPPTHDERLARVSHPQPQLPPLRLPHLQQSPPPAAVFPAPKQQLTRNSPLVTLTPHANRSTVMTQIHRITSTPHASAEVVTSLGAVASGSTATASLTALHTGPRDAVERIAAANHRWKEEVSSGFASPPQSALFLPYLSQQACRLPETMYQQMSSKENFEPHNDVTTFDSKGTTSAETQNRCSKLVTATGDVEHTSVNEYPRANAAEGRHRRYLRMMSHTPTSAQALRHHHKQERGTGQQPSVSVAATAAYGLGVGQAAALREVLNKQVTLAAPPNTYRGESTAPSTAAATLASVASLAGQESSTGETNYSCGSLSRGDQLLSTFQGAKPYAASARLAAPLDAWTNRAGESTEVVAADPAAVCAQPAPGAATGAGAAAPAGIGGLTEATAAASSGIATQSHGTMQWVSSPHDERLQDQWHQVQKPVESLRQHRELGQYRRPPSPLRARWLREELLRLRATGQLRRDNFPLEEVESLLEGFHVHRVNGKLVYNIGDEGFWCTSSSQRNAAVRPSGDTQSHAELTFSLPDSRRGVKLMRESCGAGRQGLTERSKEVHCRPKSTTGNTENSTNQNNKELYLPGTPSMRRCTSRQSTLEGSRYENHTAAPSPRFEIWLRENHRVGEEFLKDVEQIVDVAASLYAPSA